MKVLHFTTWREKCGIGGYAEGLIDALNARNVTNQVYPLRYRERKYLTTAEIRADLLEMCRQAEAFDLVHLQHEFGFYADASGKLEVSIEHFHMVLRELHRRGRPVVVNFHSE